LSVLFGPIVDQVLFQEGDDVFGFVDFFIFPRGAEIVDDLEGGFDADVVADKLFFEFFEHVLVDASSQGEDGFEGLVYLLAAFGQSGF